MRIKSFRINGVATEIRILSKYFNVDKKDIIKIKFEIQDSMPYSYKMYEYLIYDKLIYISGNKIRGDYNTIVKEDDNSISKYEIETQPASAEIRNLISITNNHISNIRKLIDNEQI